MLFEIIAKKYMQQFLLNFPHHKQYFEEDFIVTEANQLAYKHLTNWPDIWGVNPYPYALAIYGSEGCGKTHLARIWQRRSNAYFISPNEKFNIFQHNCFIIEDMDSKIWDETYLFHCFNQLHEHKKYILFTATHYNSLTNFNLADLRSRINSLYHLKILSPSEELIKVMLLKHFSERELKVSIEVVNFLACRIPRVFSEIFKIVEVLDKAALTYKKNITIPLIKKVLEV